MDKAILKKFAIESRQDLMQKIESKIKLFYVDETFSKQQNGDVYVLSNEKHTLSLSKEEYEKRELLIKRINELGIEQVIEEAAYTWFNRIVAIRYMEINDYLPLTKDNQSLGIRVLSSKDNTPDPEIMKFTNLTNPDLDIDFKKEKYIELKDDNEKYKYVLLLICKKLGKVIPQVFGGITDYIDLLIPDNLLNDVGFISKILKEIDEENYCQVEIIGWLYQFYISEKKDEVFNELKKNIRIKKENVPSATQIFTPDWIVKYMVQNTLGNYASANVRKKLEFFIERDEDIKEKNITEIKFIDPCCGSGHILVYAFELFYLMYEDLGYNKKDIPLLILKNNLYGMDIDDRAGQLANLSVLLKARYYDKDLFYKCKELNIMSIQEANSINKDILFDVRNNNTSETIDYLLNKFFDSKEYGTILDVEKFDYDEVIKLIKEQNNIFVYELSNKMLPVVKQAKIMSSKYDVVVTNPPYMGNKGMSEKLYKYAEKNYSDSKIDLFSIFIKKCGNICKENGYYALITPPSFLFLASFEKLREYLIRNKSIKSLLHMGRGIFGVDFGSTSFVIKNKADENYIGDFFKLHERNFQYIESEDIKNIFLNAKNNNDYKFDFTLYPNTQSNCENAIRIYYKNQQSNFLNIPGKPFAYWITEKEFDLFNKYPKIGDLFEARGGMTTGNNDLFLRCWYEVDFNKMCFGCSKEAAIESNKKWFPYNKGGDYRKWYGNMNYVINWYDDGIDIKNYKLEQRKINPKYNIAIAGLNSMFLPQISWSLVSAGSFGARYYPKGFLFDVAGSSVLPSVESEKYLLAYLNSKIADRYLKAFNPTINYQPGDIKSLIYYEKNKTEIENLAEINIKLAKDDWDSFETSWNFQKNPLIINDKKLICECYEEWLNDCNIRFNTVKENEELINKSFISLFDLTNEITSVMDDDDITIRKADKIRDIKSLISYAVGCMFGRYSLDKDGLVFAGGEFDENNYKTFKADADNIIPITDEAYFADDIVARFKDFIEVVYGKDTLNANFDFIAETLGKKGTETSEETIRRYFLNDFYSDHIKMYQKKPIYWLFDSGKKNGFKALIYMHRYNENTVPKVRLDYLHRVQNTYDKLLTDVNYRLTTELSVSDKKIAQNRQADLNAKLQEITAYDEKIAHIANQRISIDLDDGVTANYSKFADILAKIK